MIDRIDNALAARDLGDDKQITLFLKKAAFFNYQGEPRKAYEVLTKLRGKVEADAELAEKELFTIIYLQGVTSLRLGENENCVLCRGESACIFPIRRAAIHTNPEGSRQAITHFTEYLQQFPDDIEVRWLLNLAYMTSSAV